MRIAAALVGLAACAGPATPPSTGSSPGAPPADAAAGPAPAPVVMRCAAGAARGDFNPYDEQRTLDSDGDAVTDACDASGDLVSYQCELEELGCPGGGGREHGFRPVAPCYQQTGRVEATTIDCDGMCRAGACAVRCPHAGDRLTYLELDAGGNPVFESDADPRRFACRLAFDQRDDFDCMSDPKVGDILAVEGLGMSSSWCTGGNWGAISDHHCTYSDCHFVVP